MLTIISRKEFFERLPSQKLIVLTSKKRKVASVDIVDVKNIEMLPALDSDSLLLYGAKFPVFISESEFLEVIKYVVNNNINMPFINFENAWDFDEITFAKILVKMIESKRDYYIVTDNPKLKMIYKGILNFKVPVHNTLIVDLHNLFHVRFYASPITYGNFKKVITMPNNLIESFKSFLEWVFYKSNYDAIYFVTDSKENWRKKYQNQLLFNYFYGGKEKNENVFSSKNHKEKEEELIQQIDICESIIQKLGFPLIKRNGYEADDVIASLTKKLSEEFPNAQHYIYSNDKDLWQLLEYPNVKIFNPKDHKIYDQNNDPALNKFGVPYYRVAEYLALVGDSSDGVPGVKGIGPKKAVSLLNLLSPEETLMEILKINENNLPKNIKKTYDMFVNNLHQFILSYQMVYLPRNLFNDFDKIWFYFSLKDTVNFNQEEEFLKIFSSFSSS